MLPSMLPNRPEDAKTLADSLTVKRLKMAPDGRGVLIEVRVPPSFARPQQEERIASCGSSSNSAGWSAGTLF